MFNLFFNSCLMGFFKYNIYMCCVLNVCKWSWIYIFRVYFILIFVVVLHVQLYFLLFLTISFAFRSCKANNELVKTLYNLVCLLLQ
jgi:hypothetical protein